MPARLSSLLVRDGLVGVKRMEKAFQRQVIYGGSLDTILLEMSLVPEDRLTQYLALASGLPPAARDEGDHIDPEAVALLTRETAHLYRAVPVALENDAIRVLVCAPLELSALEDLADLVDRPIQPLITPEYRWNLVYATAYGLDPPARFTTLARSLDVDATAPPVGKARTVIIDEPAPIVAQDEATEKTAMPARLTPSAPPAEGRPSAAPPLAPVGGDAETMRLASPTAAAEAAPALTPEPAVAGSLAAPAPPETEPPIAAAKLEPVAASAADDPPPDREAPARTHPSTEAHTEAGLILPRSSAAPGAPDESAVPEHAEPGAAFATPSTGIPRPMADGAGPDRVPAVRAVRRPSAAPIPTESRDGALAAVTARELLATAEDRDTVFLTLLRAMRWRTRWAGLMTVQGGAAVGRVALADSELDTKAFETVLIPLDVPSAFRTVVANQRPHIGTLVSGDPSIDAMMLRFGGTLPPTALLLPVVIRERVVALAVGHRVNTEVRLADVTELFPLATAASDAIARLIVKHKSAGYRAPTAAPVVEIETHLVDTRPIAREGRWSTPAARPSVPSLEHGAELSIETNAPRPITQLLDVIERGAEGTMDAAMSEAVDRAKETMPELLARFPGQLRVDRFNVPGRPLRASQYGGLLELVIRLGSAASELLIEKLSAPQRDVRFYATVCAAELRPRSAVYALAERLFDQDFGVRACAMEALAGYPANDLTHALVRARRGVHSSDPEVVGAATAAIVELGDVEAVADLIGVLERADRGGEHARKALVELTAQDFGTSERKWRKWYETARGRHRIEWLIEGLGHKDDVVREHAIRALRRLTGEYFGYHHDLPRRDREVAADRWVAWWRDTGQRRFTIVRDDERQRPTGTLPNRRDPS